MRDFLDLIHGDSTELVEIRAIMDGKVKQWWTPDRAEATGLALKLSDQGWDVYYGVLPRVRSHGTAEDVVSSTDTLWADIDDKAYGGSKGAALMALVDYEIPPAVIVDSGHGYHAYWKISTKLWVPRALVIMKGLARQLHGDHVYDAPRILRIPGTVNWKDPEHPLPVRVIRFDATRTYRPGDFDRAEQIGSAEERRPAPLARPYVQPSEREPLPDWLTSLIRDGVPQGQRSEQSFKVMCHLIRRGWSDAEIREVFDYAGIGEKMREMRTGGERWFRRSLMRAHQNLR